MKRKMLLLCNLLLALVMLNWGALIRLSSDQEAVFLGRGPNLAVAQGPVRPGFGVRRGYEVWVIDQSDTTPDGGGTLSIYSGDALAGPDPARVVPEVIDLGGAARDLCLAQTGTAPRRPHLLRFNAAQTHAIIAFAGTGHVLFMDAARRTPIQCVDVGQDAVAAIPAPNQRYVVVANEDGKLLQRITTKYATNRFTLDNAATLNLATCVTPAGAPCEDAALRPENAPVWPAIDASSHFAFVTLRGGGLLVVDSTATPMRIVAEYDRTTVHPAGGMGIQAGGKMYIDAGGGTPANPLGSDLYVFPANGFSGGRHAPNTPAPKLVFSHDDRGLTDSHGLVLPGDGRFLWVADRAANRIVVVDTRSDTVVNEIELAGALSTDPAPDLMDISPTGDRVFISLRGSVPLTENDPIANNAFGTTPGLAIMQVEEDGRQGVLQAIARISHRVQGVERADPRALRVRIK
jgi:DNA-binding beta-propeller fold protein YncE